MSILRLSRTTVASRICRSSDAAAKALWTRHYVAARRAPSVRRAQAQQHGKRPDQSAQAQDQTEALPPRALLSSARSSGVLSLSPEQSLGFLRDYLSLGPTPGVDVVKKLCHDRGLDPRAVTLLAHVANRSPRAAQRLLGRRLLFSASALADAGATTQLVSQALRTSQLTRPEFKDARRHLDQLAHDDDRHPQAMLLRGQIHEDQAEIAQALALYQRAAACSGDADGADLTRADAWIALGLLRRRSDDASAARQAFQKAADLDEPLAFFHLANTYAPSSSDYLVLQLKCASSGIPAAAHNVAAFYEDLAGVAEDTTRSAAAATNLAWAREWYSVSATAGLPLSMIRLALLLRREGKVEDGKAWLRRAQAEVDAQAELGLEVSSLLAGWSEAVHVPDEASVARRIE